MIEVSANSITPVDLVMVEVNYLRTIGSSLVKSVKKMESTYQDDLYSVCILSTQAIELLLKSVIASEICLKHYSDSEEGIKCLVKANFRSHGHNLESLFTATQQIKDALEVKSVLRFNSTGFVDDYRILLNDGSELDFKVLEGARYGSFARNKNLATFLDCRVFAFLAKVDKECFTYINEVYKKLREVKKNETV